MGLDLNVSMRPNEGHEDEFWALWCDWMIEAGKMPGKPDSPAAPGFVSRLFGAKQPKTLSQDERAQRMADIATPPYMLLDAPVVGKDPEADAWITEAAGPEGAVLHKGYHVLQLLPDHDGFPIYSNFGATHEDRTSFRGAFLQDCAEVVDEFDIMQAWGAMTPQELGQWGSDLCNSAKTYAKAKGVTEVIGRRDAPTEDGTPASAAHIADSCGRWALWWSARGHGVEPDF